MLDEIIKPMSLDMGFIIYLSDNEYGSFVFGIYRLSLVDEVSSSHFVNSVKVVIVYVDLVYLPSRFYASMAQRVSKSAEQRGQCRWGHVGAFSLGRTYCCSLPCSTLPVATRGIANHHA
ncbi:hypothetical protein [Shewanella sp. VB17]|uniref:hypothetical protein n=1 Tax=Shewanella sp. VB17 TaxID=2739432 RepID=UPI0020B89EC9|nr:hypothetical protein [Shewanella sp. VB17]